MGEFLTKVEIEDTFPTFRNQYRDWLKQNYDKLLPEDRYRITIEIYTNDGYLFPRHFIIGLKHIKPNNYLKDLPDVFHAIDPITVYRATSMSPHSARTELSWTTNKNVAIWFYQRLHKSVRRLYAATICKNRIIAYTNQRNEFEVIQHCGVQNIQEVHVTDEEIEIAIEEHKKCVSKRWNDFVNRDIDETMERDNTAPAASERQREGE